MRYQCKHCGANGICMHGSVRSECSECDGAALCYHNKRRSRCKLCKQDHPTDWIRSGVSAILGLSQMVTADEDNQSDPEEAVDSSEHVDSVCCRCQERSCTCVTSTEKCIPDSSSETTNEVPSMAQATHEFTHGAADLVLRAAAVGTRTLIAIKDDLLEPLGPLQH